MALGHKQRIKAEEMCPRPGDTEQSWTQCLPSWSSPSIVEGGAGQDHGSPL